MARKIEPGDLMYAVCFYESGRVIAETNSQAQAAKLAKRYAKRFGEEITIKTHDTKA